MTVDQNRYIYNDFLCFWNNFGKYINNVFLLWKYSYYNHSPLLNPFWVPWNDFEVQNPSVVQLHFHSTVVVIIFPKFPSMRNKQNLIRDNSFKSNLLYWKIWLQGKYERASEGQNGATLWSKRVIQKMSNVLVCPASDSFLVSATSLALTSSAMIDNSVNQRFWNMSQNL